MMLFLVRLNFRKYMSVKVNLSKTRSSISTAISLSVETDAIDLKIGDYFYVIIHANNSLSKYSSSSNCGVWPLFSKIRIVKSSNCDRKCSHKCGGFQ